MLKIGFLFILIAFISTASSSAAQLKVIESDGFNIYFPKRAGPLAQRVALWCVPMAEFLKEQDIPISKPLHILLDQDLDQPGPSIQLFPHREIRLPMRAPGAFEDGYTEPDPWQYFLFKGLCVLGIYNERSGLPAGVYRLFGEVISPNSVLPNWTVDGISHLLYEIYALHRVSDPIAEAVIKAGAIPSLDKVSHHPEVWPGRFSYRIYGRPFIRWLYQRFGWEKMLRFLQLHGRGIIPIEIDFKARRAFGLTWNQLWQQFQFAHTPNNIGHHGKHIVGYWDAPYHYWNENGVYPGVLQPGIRSRHGYVDQHHWLWISEYREGISKIKMHLRGTVHTLANDHIWDPGPGAVAITRHGVSPYLILFGPRKDAHLVYDADETVPIKQKIGGPAGAIQMSGPVMDEQGRIAVAAVRDGNWDIWLYDQKWYRVTDAPSIEIDPWFIDGKLIFSSNITGRFQIHGTNMVALTKSSTAAVLPRSDSCLELDATGWRPLTIDRNQIPALSNTIAENPESVSEKGETKNHIKDYSALKSLWPNYIAPDYFFNIDDFQLGLSTNAADVSRAYTWNAGFRYDFDDGHTTWRLGYHAKELSARVTRYPLVYSTQRGTTLDEMRFEINVSWSPETLEELTLASNWRRFAPRQNISDDDWWASIIWKDRIGGVHTALNFDAFHDSSKSIYGSLRYGFGEKIVTIARIQGGHTWGDLNSGHNTFRIGGNSGEGYFTQRYSRLFPMRGFDSNIVEDRQAMSTSLDIRWPFAQLQAGYKTLPFFFHNITAGTFIDAGYAYDHFEVDELFVSAGIEFITGMQLAWDNKSSFSIGLAWPLRKPSDIEQSGPVWLILIGRPL